MADGVAHDGKVWVRGAPCDACLLSPNRIVDGARAAAIIRDVDRSGSHFICHKNQTDDEPTAVCRNWYDRLGHTSNDMRIAARLGLIAYTEVST